MIPPSPHAAQLAAKPLTRSSLDVLGGTTELWTYGPVAGDTGESGGSDDGGSPAAGVVARDSAPTILLVHGFRGDHHGLEPIAARLPGFTVIVPDLPGFGISTPLKRTHDIAGYSAWLRDLVSQLDLGPDAVILGHSFGSIIVAAALAGGLEAERVILVNPIAAPALSGPRGILTRLAVFYYKVGAWLPQKLGFAWLRLALVTRFISITMAKTKNRALRAWIHDQHHRYFGAFSNRAVVVEAFEASVSNDVSEFAAQITPPTLLIAGDRDDITPVAAEERLATLIPDARLVVLHGVGHLIHYERPVEAARAISAFVAERQARQALKEREPHGAQAAKPSGKHSA
ncbi:alpha/beta fold hydrolase [Subtercola endophyticus]|uniref:alpha/beta fold hydrolase n=1 Tax=Subtercola endophyticus TaxID=2895559 RepID=UPI001E30A992|nr:alpha/beta hydrolase [Subtercola endophyticus]UFS60366.1 alpha/beta hydrolase [Subtercola endophyticus]